MEKVIPSFPSANLNKVVWPEYLLLYDFEIPYFTQRKLLDTSLGFAAGVMIAASYWSLLAPAIEMAEQSSIYGKNGEFAFIPVAVGFFLGALFVYMVDIFLSEYNWSSPEIFQGKIKQI